MEELKQSNRYFVNSAAGYVLDTLLNRASFVALYPEDEHSEFWSGFVVYKRTRGLSDEIAGYCSNMYGVSTDEALGWVVSHKDSWISGSKPHPRAPNRNQVDMTLYHPFDFKLWREERKGGTL